MVLTPIENNKVVSEEQNSIPVAAVNLTLKNHIRQLIDRVGVYSSDATDCWGEAYTAAGGRNIGVNTGTTTAIFDTNKYKPFNSFVIIEATSISNVSDFAINTCIIKEIDTGKWLLYSTSADGEVRKAQIAKTLFYGTDGSNARASSTYITGITSIKTNITEWVGLQAHYGRMTTSSSGNNSTYTGTFANTTTNTSVSHWSFCNSDTNGSTSYQMPSGTTINSTSTGTSDHTGTDRTADIKSNPASVILYTANSNPVGAHSATIRTIILCKGGISWAATGSTTRSLATVDFNVDNSIPLFSTATEDIAFEITHTIPSGTFPTTISSAVGSFLAQDWEAGASVQYKLTNATEDTGWLNSNEVSTFTAFTSQPTALIVNLVPKSSSPSAGYPSIRGFAIKAE